ncbi:uncharacterized protein PAC_06048 [Phialocephala subalpina]|uniref:Uncharacterized protein n=1 Tax=Phialocephala subalpina TaxID=576137 RepID=A0A1L7WTS5_9HELO|nr:uncharacterized protein PAC_06048 [Phialocephala subalpina]
MVRHPTKIAGVKRSRVGLSLADMTDGIKSHVKSLNRRADSGTPSSDRSDYKLALSTIRAGPQISSTEIQQNIALPTVQEQYEVLGALFARGIASVRKLLKSGGGFRKELVWATIQYIQSLDSGYALSNNSEYLADAHPGYHQIDSLDEWVHPNDLCTPGQSVRITLESKGKRNIMLFWDLRQGQDALFHHSGIVLGRKIDVQLLELACRNHPQKQQLLGLGIAVMKDGVWMTTGEKAEWDHANKKAKEHGFGIFSRSRRRHPEPARFLPQDYGKKGMEVVMKETDIRAKESMSQDKHAGSNTAPESFASLSITKVKAKRVYGARTEKEVNALRPSPQVVVTPPPIW